MTKTQDPETLRKRRDEIREELARIGDLRPGSLVGGPTVIVQRRKGVAMARAGH
jgi:hypothetical protein